MRRLVAEALGITFPDSKDATEFVSGSDTMYLIKVRNHFFHVNFGFWDVIPSTHEKGYFNRKIERKTMELGGAKGLYSSAWYDEAEFWSIYDQPRYKQLKQTYDPQGVFPDLYSKCVRRH